METTRALIIEHRPFVRASLVHLGVTTGALDDAEQDVFLVVVRRRRDYDATRGTSFRGWVWGICRNVAFSHRRTARRRAAVGPAVDPGRTPPVDERICAAMALETLDEQTRALWLARCEGRTASELARELELPLTTVQWRLRRAKRSLREVMRDVARHGHALVVWLLRPRHGLIPLAAPALIMLLPSLQPRAPEARAEAALLHQPQPQPQPQPTKPTSEHPPPAKEGVEAVRPEGHVTQREPWIRRRHATGRVSLGEPLVEGTAPPV